VDGVFGCIDGLELPSNLACAVGLLVSYKTTKNREDLMKAVNFIDEGGSSTSWVE